MTFSKKLLSPIFVTFVAILSAGCSTESTKKKDVGFNEPNRFPGEGNFRVDAMTAKSTINAEYNDYAILTKKKFNFEACIKDPVYASVQAALPFAVVDGAGNEKLLYTDSRGCLNWSETHSFQYFADETYIKIKRRFESRNFYKGYAIAEVALNPWMDGGASVLDLRYNELPANAPVVEMDGLSMNGQELGSAGVRNVKINLKSASFEFVGLDYDNYEITPSLGLKVAHKYMFRISPSVIRRTINRLVVPEVLNTGRMKALMVILREDSNPATQYTLKNVISSTEFEGDMLYGELVGTSSIKFNSVSELTSRTLALVTLIPKTNLHGFPKASFVGPLAPGILRGLNLIPTDKSAEELFNQHVTSVKEQKNQSFRPVDYLSKHGGFRPVDLNVKVYNTWGPDTNLKDELEQLLKAPSAMRSPNYFKIARSLCQFVFPEPGSIGQRRCVLNPGVIELKKLKFVDQLNSTRPVPVGITTIDSFRVNASMSVSGSVASSAGLSLKAGFSQPLGELGILKASVGGDAAYGMSYRRDRSQGSSVSRERSLTAEGNAFRFNVNTRLCVVGQVRKELIATMKPQIPGVFYCQSQTKNEDVIEHYYLIGSKTGVDGSPFSDNASNSSTVWRMMIRGTATKNVFAELLAKNVFDFVFFKRDEKELKLYERFKEMNNVIESHQTEIFPGVLSVDSDDAQPLF